MPSKKKKYNARFPAGRIKKIMQTDEEVGKVAQAVPVIISRTLELFVESLLTKTMQITSAKNAKTLSPSHMKQCILSESRFDFLKDLVKGVPDVSGPDDDMPTPPLTPATPTTPGMAAPILCPPQPPPTRHPEIGVIKEVGSSRTTSGSIRRNSKESRGSACSSSTVSNEGTRIITPPPHAPEFQISVPTSFQISQPNFYTEVNPLNLTTNSSNANATNQTTSNYIHTANIDEDYDT